MFERELITQLQNRSKKEVHNPLVISGVRQVGKSTLVRAFVTRITKTEQINGLFLGFFMRKSPFICSDWIISYA